MLCTLNGEARKHRSRPKSRFQQRQTSVNIQLTFISISHISIHSVGVEGGRSYSATCTHHYISGHFFPHSLFFTLSFLLLILKTCLFSFTNHNTRFISIILRLFSLFAGEHTLLLMFLNIWCQIYFRQACMKPVCSSKYT